MHLLVVDDDSFYRKMLCRQLLAAGVERVTEAENGTEALSIFHDEAGFDLAIIDVLMPDMDGIELIRHLSGTKSCPPIVLISGMELSVLKATVSMALARRLTIVDALTKPVKKSDISGFLIKANEMASRASRPVASIDPGDLSRGIESDELFFQYQPKVHLIQQRLSGFEALVRWRHPDHGLLFPDAFIGLAESTGLIAEMTSKLVRIGFEQLLRWEQKGLETSLSINLSPTMLIDPSLPNELASAADQASIDPSRIVMEITETGKPLDEAVYLEIVTRLHLKGFRISIDDFGTGESSLLKLEALPFSELKVDRAFVDGATEDEIKRAILEASIGLAAALEMDCVAEGVETVEDWRLLQELGCPYAQGYFVSRPISEDAAIDWAESGFKASAG